MNRYKQILCAVLLLVIILELSWYQYWEKEVDRLTALTQSTKTEKKVSYEALNKDQVIKVISQWFNQQTGNIYNFNCVFLEKGERTQKTDYIYSPEECTPQHIAQKTVRIMNGVKKDNLILATIVDHQTSHYFFLVMHPRYEGVQPFVYTDGNLPPEYNTAIDFGDILNVPSYMKHLALKVVQMIAFHTKQNFESLKSDLRTSMIDYQAKYAKKHTKVTSSWNVSVNDPAHRHLPRALQNKGGYKRRLPWYGLIILVFFVIQFYKAFFKIVNLLGRNKRPGESKKIQQLSNTIHQLKEEKEKLKKQYESELAEYHKNLRILEQQLAQQPVPSKSLGDLLKDFLKTRSVAERQNFLHSIAGEYQIPVSISTTSNTGEVTIEANIEEEIVTMMELLTGLRKLRELPKKQQGKFDSLQAQLELLKTPRQFIEKSCKNISKDIKELEKKLTKDNLLDEIDALIEQAPEKSKLLVALQNFKTQVTKTGVNSKIQATFSRLKQEAEQATEITV